MNSLPDIKRAMKSQELNERCAWLERYCPEEDERGTATVFEQGLGLFGSAEDAALLDEVVELAYASRRRAGSLCDAL